MVQIRDIVVDDAPGIGRVHVRSWQTAYVGLVDQQVLDALDVAQRTRMWRDTWLAVPPEGPRLVAEVDDTIVGFVVGTRSSPSTPGCGEILSIYLDPDHWRAGIGTALFHAAIDGLLADGPMPLVLWVLEGNQPAISFYERHGWYDDGGRKVEDMFGDPVPHLRYRLTASYPPGS